MAFWNRIINWFRDLSARDRLINDFNKSAREAFTLLSVGTLLEVRTKRGDANLGMSVQVSYCLQDFALEQPMESH